MNKHREMLADFELGCSLWADACTVVLGGVSPSALTLNP